jgi:uncharacterized protein (DUF433 family)
MTAIDANAPVRKCLLTAGKRGTPKHSYLTGRSRSGHNYGGNNCMVDNMTKLLSERITLDPAICHGKPCIRGLRYPVENILEWLSSGMSIEDILADYEDLEREDILAALEFASRVAKVQRIEMLAV